MPTIEDLGKEAKQQYPGSYDDLSDIEVGQKIKTKYPAEFGEYEDIALPTFQQPEKPKSLIRRIGEFVSPSTAKIVDYAREQGMGAKVPSRLVAGSALELGSLAVPGGIAAKGATKGIGLLKGTKVAAQVAQAPRRIGLLKSMGQIGAASATFGAGRAIGEERPAPEVLEQAFTSGILGGVLGGAIGGTAFGARKIFGKTGGLPEALYRQIFRSANDDLRLAYRTLSKGQELNPTLAQEVLERGLRGSSQNMAIFSLRKLDQLEQQVQERVGQSANPIKLNKQEIDGYKNLLQTISGTFRSSFFAERAKEANNLLKQLNSVGKTRELPMGLILSLRRYLDRMRNTTSFKLDANLSPKQEEFKFAANELRKKLANAGLADLMKEERIFIQAVDSIVDDAVRRGNRRLLGLTDYILGGGGLVSGAGVPGFGTGLTLAGAARAFQRPEILTNLGQGLAKVGRVSEKVLPEKPRRIFGKGIKKAIIPTAGNF